MVRLLMICALMTACAADETVEPGLLAPNYGVVEGPATVSVAQSFVVHVATFGDGCVRFERTDVEIRADGADIRPFDRVHHPSGDEACTQILNHYTHDATLTFDSPGTKTIVVHGSIERGVKRDDYPWPLSVVVE